MVEREQPRVRVGIVGAQPFAAFQKVVDGELAKVAAKK